MNARAVWLAGAIAVSMVGCSPTARHASSAVDAYRGRAYYEGAIVYYDKAGAPFVIRDDEIRYVPATYEGYGDLVARQRDPRSEERASTSASRAPRAARDPSLRHATTR